MNHAIEKRIRRLVNQLEDTREAIDCFEHDNAEMTTEQLQHLIVIATNQSELERKLVAFIRSMQGKRLKS